MARNRVIRRSAGFVRSGPVRQTEWLAREFSTDAITVPLLTFQIDSSMDAVEKAKLPFTITRTIGVLSIFGDQAGAIEHPFGALGGLVVSDKASALGATAVPDPVTEAASDLWFMYQSFVGPQTTALDGPGPTSWMIDSRAQRKVQEGEDIVFVIANPNSVDGFRYVFNYRLLIKLS